MLTACNTAFHDSDHSKVSIREDVMPAPCEHCRVSVCLARTALSHDMSHVVKPIDPFLWISLGCSVHPIGGVQESNCRLLQATVFQLLNRWLVAMAIPINPFAWRIQDGGQQLIQNIYSALGRPPARVRDDGGCIVS